MHEYESDATNVVFPYLEKEDMGDRDEQDFIGIRKKVSEATMLYKQFRHCF